MDYFIRIVMEKTDSPLKLDESVFKKQNIYETAQGASVIEIPLNRHLSEEEADRIVEKLSTHLFNSGLTDFDIEMSTDAHATNQIFVFGITQGSVYDTFPQQKQRHWFLLVIAHDKGATHFDRLRHHVV